MRLSPVIAFLVAFASPATGQVRARQAIADSSPARIMARVGTNAAVPWLRNILRQSDTTYSRTKLDEIGDSLVARGVDARSAEARSNADHSAIEAVIALTNAGRSSTGPGHPYAGALDRLIAIHRQSPASSVRAHALEGMLAVSDRSRALQYLQAVAESKDETAYDAVEAMVADANGSGWAGEKPSPSEQQATIAALNALHTRHRVTDRATWTLLDSWVENHRPKSPST